MNLRQAIESELDKQMQAKGLTRAEAGRQADVVARFYGGLEETAMIDDTRPPPRETGRTPTPSLETRWVPVNPVRAFHERALIPDSCSLHIGGLTLVCPVTGTLSVSQVLQKIAAPRARRIEQSGREREFDCGFTREQNRVHRSVDRCRLRQKSGACP